MYLVRQLSTIVTGSVCLVVLEGCMNLACVAQVWRRLKCGAALCFSGRAAPVIPSRFPLTTSLSRLAQYISPSDNSVSVSQQWISHPFVPHLALTADYIPEHEAENSWKKTHSRTRPLSHRAPTFIPPPFTIVTFISDIAI